jgi:hypothetical protein
MEVSNCVRRPWEAFVGLKSRLDNGEKMRFSLKDIGANIRSHDRTYGLEPGRTARVL